MSKLDPEFKAKWVAALRSGGYKQWRGGYTNWKEGKYDAFCCLGVAAVLCGKDPKNAADMWSPRVSDLGVNCDDASFLAAMNDGKHGQAPHSFAEIADYIERNL